MQFQSYEEQDAYYKKMDEHKKRREQREDEISFLEFLQLKLTEIESLSHRNKSNSAYQDACYLMQRINSRFHREDDGRHLWGTPLPEKRHLELTLQELKPYKSNLSDKRKREILNDFRKQLMEDLESMIRSREVDTGSTI